MDTDPQPRDLALELPRDTYRQILQTLRGRLPPPDTDAREAPGSTPSEALAQRDRAAIARVASMLPGNADEADIAARCVAYSDYGLHCLREARGPLGDIACFLKCTAQAPSMTRQARGARSLLLRLQTERHKREADNAATDRAAWIEHCALGMMADALDDTAGTAAPEPPPSPPAPQPPAEEPVADLAAEADLYAVMYPRRAALIRSLGGLPEPCDFGPPEPELVHAIVTGTSPHLRELDIPAEAEATAD
jgi:hypothetical protein